MLMICKAGHLDHGLTMEQLRWVLETFGDRSEFFIETVEMPENLGTLPCALYGPLMGDEPITDEQVHLRVRLGREWPSRMVERPVRGTRKVTIIAGPHAGLPCVLYTIYGGPPAPREVDDPDLPEADREEAKAFWSEHALAFDPGA